MPEYRNDTENSIKITYCTEESHYKEGSHKVDKVPDKPLSFTIPPNSTFHFSDMEGNSMEIMEKLEISGATVTK